MSDKTFGSRIADSLREFADCEHKHWKCDKCGCRTNGPDVDSLCNGNAIHKLNQMLDEPPEVTAACDNLERSPRQPSKDWIRLAETIVSHYLKIRKYTP